MASQAIIENKKVITGQIVERKNNPAAEYLGGLDSDRSKKVQADALNIIADILSPGADLWTIPWEMINPTQAANVRAILADRYSAATANRMLSAFRMTIRRVWKDGLIDADTRDRIADIKNVKGSKVPAGRKVTSGEIRALADVCKADESPAGFRDAAIIALMVTVGPRRAEVVGLDLSDYDPETGQVKILGKGNKERLTYLANGTRAAMDDWLQVRGSEPGALFVPIDRHGNMTLKNMTHQAIYNMLNKRIEQAGIKDFSPHDLRRTFISDMLDAGADIATVAKMVGHASVTTTARYDRRPEKAKQQAAELLSFPYTRRLATA